MAAQQQPPQQEVIERFTNEGQRLLCGSLSSLTYTGSIVAGMAEGRGTVRCEGGACISSEEETGRKLAGRSWTLRDAEFQNGRMLPCRAVLALDKVKGSNRHSRNNSDGNLQYIAYAGPLAASGAPADGARGACVLREDGGRFQGDWPEHVVECFAPQRGAAWDPRDGSVWAVALNGLELITGPIAHSGWGPGTHEGWRRLGVMERPTAQQVPQPAHSPGRPQPIATAGP
jgi:hypothetical protein